MVSLVILCIMVIGSFYSYGFVQTQIEKVARKRADIGMVQGLMETAMAYTKNTIHSERPKTILDLQKTKDKIISHYYAEIFDRYNETRDTVGIDLSLAFHPEVVYDESVTPTGIYANIWIHIFEARPTGIRYLDFKNGGPQQITGGMSIIGMNSGAYAYVADVILRAGSWDDKSATGTFRISNQNGQFRPEDIKIYSCDNCATVFGNSSPAGFNQIDKGMSLYTEQYIRYMPL